MACTCVHVCVCRGRAGAQAWAAPQVLGPPLVGSGGHEDLPQVFGAAHGLGKINETVR